jgi:hypothetical protein
VLGHSIDDRITGFELASHLHFPDNSLSKSALAATGRETDHLS